MVETPAATEAASRLDHSPRGQGHGKKLPARALQRITVVKRVDAQAGRQRAERQDQGAGQRPLPQPEDVHEGHRYLTTLVPPLPIEKGASPGPTHGGPRAENYRKIRPAKNQPPGRASRPEAGRRAGRTHLTPQ